jgi:hypothetical protein
MPNKKKYIEDHPYISYSKPILTDEDMLENQNPFMTLWTTDAVREFSDRAVPREVVELNKNSFDGPSGAHKQPWTFVWYQIQI